MSDGIMYECDCGDYTPNSNGVCDICARVKENELEKKTIEVLNSI